MRSTFYVALSAVATLVAADSPNPFNIPKGGYSFTVGEPTTLKWQPNSDGTVSLKLQSGEVLTPDGGSTIASHIDNSGSFTWTPPKDISNESDYTIEIVDDDDTDEVNYLPRFTVSGATASASSTPASTPSSSSGSSSGGSGSGSSNSDDSDDSDAASTTASDNAAASATADASSSSNASDKSASASATGASASSSSDSSSSSASKAKSSDAASSSSDAQGASETGTDTSAGVMNRVSGGLLALALGVIALM